MDEAGNKKIKLIYKGLAFIIKISSTLNQLKSMFHVFYDDSDHAGEWRVSTKLLCGLHLSWCSLCLPHF